MKPSGEVLSHLHSCQSKHLLQCQPSPLPRAGLGPEAKLRLDINVIREYYMGGNVADDKLRLSVLKHQGWKQ